MSRARLERVAWGAQTTSADIGGAPQRKLDRPRGAPERMAGLIGLTAHDIEIQDALAAIRWKYEGEWIPHPVVRFTTTLPVAVQEDGERVVTRARWGFDIGGGRPVGNARDDKLQGSRLWSSMLGKTPCLFAATGVYEQVKSEAGKTSYWFRRRDQEPIVMPGLCATRKVKGEPRLCAAIITTTPNRFFSQYHNRQVCAVTPDEADAWMDESDPDALMRLLHAPKSEAWEAVPVDDAIFGRGRREMEHLVEIGEPERWTED